MKLLLLAVVLMAVFIVKGDMNGDIEKMVTDSLDWSIDPCTDFYQFSCGGWFNKTEIPADASRFDRAFFPISENNERILREILAGNSKFPKVNDFFSACMNKAQVEITGINPLSPYISSVDSISDISDFLTVAGNLQGLGISVLFGAHVERDSKNPEYNIAYFSQGGLGLPDISVYKDNETTTQYLEHIEKIFMLVSKDYDAKADARAVLAFETALAAIMLPNNQLNDPFKTYNKIDIYGLKKLMPNFPWSSFLEGLGFPELNDVSVDVVNYFKQMRSVVLSYQKSWVPYLRFHLIHEFVGQLNKDFVHANFEFYEKILNGQPEPRPDWRICVQSTDSALGELTGYEYAQVAFPGESRTIATEMIKQIEISMYDDLNSIGWMDAETRERAIEKLHGVANMIGFPDPPYKYEELDVSPTAYLVNTINAQFHARRRQFNMVGEKSNRFQWDMTADTVNAYYDPTRNEMVFPAGIMQTPFFNLSFPLSMNYGGIGMVMGHELTHGFDNQGRDFDAVGLLTDWWTDATSKKFDTKVQCVINQYDNFEILPGVFVDGKLTQGENIADMGGIKSAFNAYTRVDPENATKESIVKGLKNNQLFFVSFAQNWCSMIRPSRQKVLVKTDPHSPPRFRVLGPLMNFDGFAKTFDCPANSPMNPKDRCEVW